MLMPSVLVGMQPDSGCKILFYPDRFLSPLLDVFRRVLSLSCMAKTLQLVILYIFTLTTIHSISLAQ
jgi:hypothetical protein